MIHEPWWWQDAPRRHPDSQPDSQKPQISPPRNCDVVIVGGGFTGLSAALTLAQAGRSVCVLEAQAPGSGASTRNGGMIGSGHKVPFAALEKKYGEPVALEAMREGLRALEFTTNLIKTENIDCDFALTGRFRGAWRAMDYEATAREIEFLRQKIDLPAQMVSKAEQHTEVTTDRYHGGCIFHSHGGLNPAKFYDGILQNAEQAGAQVFGYSPVIDIEKNQAGFEVKTPDTKIQARDVLMATNGYTSRLAPEMFKRLIPISSYMITTEPLGRERVQALIPKMRMIVETRSRHCYYRPSPDGTRIMLGGRAALRQIDTVKSGRILRKLLVGIFPSLVDVSISHSWQGTLGFSTDHMPRIGRAGRDADGYYYAMGYSGSGVAMAPYLGWRAAHKILGTNEGKTGFDVLDFETVNFRSFLPVGLPFVEMWYALKDHHEGT